MGKAFWAISAILVMMTIGIILAGVHTDNRARTDCKLETKHYGKKTTKVWDCE